MNRRIKDTGDFCQAIIEVELHSKFLGQQKLKHDNISLHPKSEEGVEFLLTSKIGLVE